MLIPLKPRPCHLLRAVALLSLGVVVIATPGAIVGDVEPTEAWRMERASWTEGLPASRRIEIENPYGDVRLRNANDDHVVVHSVSQHRDDLDPIPRIVVESTVEGLRVRVMVEAGEDGRLAARADLVVFVPHDGRVHVRTDAGRIDAKRVAFPVTATSRRGPIDVVTFDTATIHSEHGAVHLMLAASDWSAPPSVETITGSIEAWFPQDADAQVDVVTTGLITTDYSLSLKRDETSGAKHARAILGTGAPTVHLRSAKGDIRILTSPLEPTSREPASPETNVGAEP